MEPAKPYQVWQQATAILNQENRNYRTKQSSYEQGDTPSGKGAYIGCKLIPPAIPPPRQSDSFLIQDKT